MVDSIYDIELDSVVTIKSWNVDEYTKYKWLIYWYCWWSSRKRKFAAAGFVSLKFELIFSHVVGDGSSSRIMTLKFTDGY